MVSLLNWKDLTEQDHTLTYIKVTFEEDDKYHVLLLKFPSKKYPSTNFYLSSLRDALQDPNFNAERSPDTSTTYCRNLWHKLVKASLHHTKSTIPKNLLIEDPRLEEELSIS